MTDFLDEFEPAGAMRFAAPPRGPAVGGPVIWLLVGDRNLDELPDRLCPIGGCPTCSSVWVSYEAVGFSVGRFESPRVGGSFDAESFLVHPAFYSMCAVSEVRLVCADGHVTEFDGRKLTPQNPWTASALRWAALGVMGYIAARIGASP